MDWKQTELFDGKKDHLIAILCHDQEEAAF